MTAVDEHLTPTAWWEAISEAVDTPIHHLVEGYDQIATQAIPYGWLPGRARTFYGDVFTTWSDLAEETITSLLARPRSGIGTVRAIVTAAHAAALSARIGPLDDPDAPTATRRLLDRLCDYDHHLLLTRRWALRPLTILAAAAQIGASPVNVERATPRAYRRFTDLLTDPTHAAVTRYALDLGHQLGSMTREHVAARALADLGVDITTDAGQMLLHVAGPYACKNGWLTDPAGATLTAATATLAAALDAHGAPTLSTLTQELGTHGINPQMAAEFLDEQPDLRRFGDKWVRWGHHLIDKIEAVLRVQGAPATATSITATIGADCTEKSVRNGLHHPRFSRATKLTWALREWGIDEYGGLYGEIAARIDAAGHPLSTQTLVDQITTAFPDVAEGSIRVYLGVPALIIERGMVRRRTAADGWPTPAPLNTARGAFHHGRNQVRLALPVNHELLRGSGHNLSSPIPAALGLHPGQQRTFAGDTHAITVSWPVSSPIGASMGSLRTHAAAVHAVLDDTLVLVFDLQNSTLDITRIPAAANPRQRLQALLGAPAPRPAIALARALRCRPRELTALLERRRERDLLALCDLGAVDGHSEGTPNIDA